MKSCKFSFVMAALAAFSVFLLVSAALGAARTENGRILISPRNSDDFMAVERVREGLLVCRLSGKAGFRRGAYWTSFKAYAKKRLQRVGVGKRLRSKLNKRGRYLARRCREALNRPIPPTTPTPAPTPDPSECEASQDGLYDYYVDGLSHCSPCSDQNQGTFSAPLCTLKKAAALAQPGAKIYVRAGVYREQLKLQVSGTTDMPIVFKTNPRNRAVISGANAVSDWRKSDFDPDVYYADLPDAPKLQQWMRNRYIKEDQNVLTNARFPKEGWLIVPSVTATTMSDPVNLRRFTRADDLIGSQVRYYSDHGSTDVVRYIVDYDPAAGTITFDKAWDYSTPGRDYYFLYNNASLITEPGEWAMDVGREVPRLYLRAADDRIQNHQYEYAVRDSVVDLASKSHTSLQGFEIRDAVYFGITTNNAADGCSLLSCKLTGNGYMGASLEGKDLLIKDNVAHQNGYGISVTNASNIVIERNHIFANEIDALLVSWGIDGARVTGNFIHDQTSWGHPDGIQTYAGVRNLIIEENAIFNTGQSVMLEDTSGLVIRNNLFAGSGASSVIMGHNNTYPVKALGNTFALINFTSLATYAPTKLTDPVRDGFQFDYEFKNNLIAAGHPSGYSFDWPAPSAAADYNLFWHEFMGVAGGKWMGSLAAWKAASGLDAHSLVADPVFVSAPSYYTASRYTQLSRKDRLYIWGDPSNFVPGDHIEVGFDGIQRSITATGQSSWTDASGNPAKINYIDFSPPLSKAILVETVISNWKGRVVAETDFRLQRTVDGYPADSPAVGAGEGGTTIGWEANLPALRRSDFDGDGLIDDERYRG